MSSLFVQDESDDEKEIRVKAEQSDEMDVDKEFPVIKSDGKEENVSVRSNQLEDVEEDVEEDDDEGEEEEKEEDDPIVKEIPIHLNPDIAEKLQLILLQYTTRSKETGKEDTGNRLPKQLQYKEKSNVVEVELPFDETKFFSKEKADKWDKIKGEKLRGVVSNNNNCQYFMGHVGTDKELHLVPVNGGTAQMRPSFKYIDELKLRKMKEEAENEKKSLRPELLREEDKKPTVTSMHVVQMTAKSSNRAIPRLGGALRSEKLENEEIAKSFDYLGKDSYDYKKFEDEMNSSEEDKILQSSETQAEYLKKLMSSIGV